MYFLHVFIKQIVAEMGKFLTVPQVHNMEIGKGETRETIDLGALVDPLPPNQNNVPSWENIANLR